jgi:predicted enzyme related to lactoylglutathione lyase
MTGKMLWTDLTVNDADQIRDFYSNVVGWTYKGISMGDYEDYEMKMPENGETVTGICHRRGPNSKLPAQWMVYFTVANVAESAEKCLSVGGKILDGPRLMGKQQFCVIQDPAGAVCALISEQ